VEGAVVAAEVDNALLVQTAGGALRGVTLDGVDPFQHERPRSRAARICSRERSAFLRRPDNSSSAKGSCTAACAIKALTSRRRKLAACRLAFGLPSLDDAATMESTTGLQSGPTARALGFTASGSREKTTAPRSLARM
jgi:hypothetical protein